MGHVCIRHNTQLRAVTVLSELRSKFIIQSVTVWSFSYQKIVSQTQVLIEHSDWTAMDKMLWVLLEKMFCCVLMSQWTSKWRLGFEKFPQELGLVQLWAMSPKLMLALVCWLICVVLCLPTHTWIKQLIFSNCMTIYYQFNYELEQLQSTINKKIIENIIFVVFISAFLTSCNVLLWIFYNLANMIKPGKLHYK